MRLHTLLGSFAVVAFAVGCNQPPPTSPDVAQRSRLGDWMNEEPSRPAPPSSSMESVGRTTVTSAEVAPAQEPLALPSKLDPSIDPWAPAAPPPAEAQPAPAPAEPAPSEATPR